MPSGGIRSVSSVAANAGDERALVHAAGHDGVEARIKLGDCGFRLIEPQAAFVLVGAVATEAAAGQERFYIAHEADGRIGGERGSSEHRQREACAQAEL